MAEGAAEDVDLQTRVADVVGRQARRYVGLAIGVVDGGRTATYGAGQQGQGGPEPDELTSFQIGSVTKVFTSLLLADAVVRGEVNLDQPLDSIITGVATYPAGRPITLQYLATHTPGLSRLPPGLREQAWRHRHDPYAYFTRADLEAALAHKPPHSPDGKVRYSNYGAGVLGEALSRVADCTFDDPCPRAHHRTARDGRHCHLAVDADRTGREGPLAPRQAGARLAAAVARRRRFAAIDPSRPAEVPPAAPRALRDPVAGGDSAHP